MKLLLWTVVDDSLAEFMLSTHLGIENIEIDFNFDNINKYQCLPISTL